jgi:putative transcriptional regulator
LDQRIGITRQTIAANEAGKHSRPLAALRIADGFGRSLEEVFQWER